MKQKTKPPAAPLDAYVRVSQVRGRNGDSFISPDVQRDRIAAWAQARGLHVNALPPEMDVSGGTIDRPVLNEAMRRVEAGESGGIVVYRSDRFGRTLIDSLGLIKRITDAGALFASVEDGFDLSTHGGRMAMKMMLVLAEGELERITENWDEARRRAVERGVHLTATVPFGYRRRDDNGLEPDDVNGPIVKELFDRRAAGEGWADLGRWMESKGAKTQRGRSRWSLRALRDIIRNDVYLGIAEHGSFRQERAHDPLTDEATWRRAQRRGSQTRSRAQEPALLGGLVRCGGCRHVMAAKTQKLADGRILHMYRCRQAEHGNGRGACQAWASLSGVEALELAEQLRNELQQKAKLRARARRVTSSSRAVVALEQAVAARNEYRDDVELQQRLGWESYRAGLEARDQLVAEAGTAVERERDEEEAEQALPDPKYFGDDWGRVPVETRRARLRSGIDTVFVRRRSSRNEPLQDRVHIRWRGMPAVDLPGKGRRDYSPRPFLFDRPDDVGALAA